MYKNIPVKYLINCIFDDYRIYRETKYVIVLNLGTENTLVDLHSTINDLPLHLTVAAASPNSGYNKG